jgi:hypothetical protein
MWEADGECQLGSISLSVLCIASQIQSINQRLKEGNDIEETYSPFLPWTLNICNTHTKHLQGQLIYDI